MKKEPNFDEIAKDKNVASWVLVTMHAEALHLKSIGYSKRAIRNELRKRFKVNLSGSWNEIINSKKIKYARK
jgi:type VI protein secretion system component VasK